MTHGMYNRECENVGPVLRSVLRRYIFLLPYPRSLRRLKLTDLKFNQVRLGYLFPRNFGDNATRPLIRDKLSAKFARHDCALRAIFLCRGVRKRIRLNEWNKKKKRKKKRERQARVRKE